MYYLLVKQRSNHKCRQMGQRMNRMAAANGDVVVAEENDEVIQGGDRIYPDEPPDISIPNLEIGDHITAWKCLDRVDFPAPTDININMMPFIPQEPFSTVPEVVLFLILDGGVDSVCFEFSIARDTFL